MRWVALLAVAALGACALPRWPVDGAISSPYGLRLRGIRPEIHRGVDIPLPVGTPVRSMGPGRVTYSGTMSGYGIVVMIDHGSGVSSVYAHLSEALVAVGDELRGRDVIGRSGATGNATGAHLHFEVWRGDRPEDPVPFLGGPPARPRPETRSGDGG